MNEELIKNVKNDRFAKLIGIKLIDVREGHAVTELVLNETHLNGLNDVQGGAIFTLGDYAFAAASNSGGITTVGINVNISYFKPPVGKVIRAVAQEVNTKTKICGYKVDILDEDGSLIASFSGLGYRKNK